MKQTPLQRRTPLKRGTTELKRTPFRRGMGQKAKANAAALDHATPALKARSMGRCEAGVPGVCTGTGEDRHHRRRVRSDNRLANLMYLCRPCHDWIHRNPMQARTLGLLLVRYQDPEKVPVQKFRRVT